MKHMQNSTLIKQDGQTKLVKTTLDHVDYLSDKLRKQDLIELERLEVKPRYALVFPFTSSKSMTYTLIHDNEPVSMIGTMESYREDFARLWMLSTENITKCKRMIAKHSGWMFDYLQAHYFRIHNIIPVENTMTIKWLEMNGFMFGDTHIINDYEFIEFFRCNFKKNNIYNEISKPVMH
tara:strand:- start:442 stop:978 length:537 start_codon:yes stop_codon:yes gene_type:complete